MRRINKPVKYPLAETFMNMLKDGADNIDGELYAIYLHIFQLQTLEDLENVLEQYQTIALGKDKYFKAEGKKCWFPVFHKAIRQCDYFNDSYRKGKIEIMTKDERSEYTHLRSIVYKKGYVKESTDPKELFNDQYRRFLQLGEIERSESREKRIGGHLDMILWHTIHLDKKNILGETMERVFKYDLVGLVK